MVDTWVLPTLTEVLALADRVGAGQLFPNVGEDLSAPSDGEGWHHSLADQCHDQKVKHQWQGAIAALDTLLQRVSASPTVTESLQANAPQHGIVISGPLPVLTHPGLTAHYATWLFKLDTINPLHWLPFQLLPGAKCDLVTVNHPILPLLPIDPLTSEQFCLVLTAQFSLVLALGRTRDGNLQFQFSFVPEVVEAAWKALRSRISLTAPHYLHQWDHLFHQFAPIAPDYRWVMQFSQLLLTSMPVVIAPASVSSTEAVAASHSPSPHRSDSKTVATVAQRHAATPTHPSADNKAIDVELLQAIAHEVRTPLATIRTLTRLLLKRKNLAPDLLQHLQAIDRECTEQIDRFGLIFRAAELETSDTNRPAMPLMPMSVAQVFQHSIPRWQQQASQRQHTLDVILPPKMPTVVSDPTMLDQVLTSLIERFTRSLPSGSHIQVQVVSAGSQLKLQLQAQPNGKDGAGAIANNKHAFSPCSYLDPSLKSLGQLLMFQPETGSLSLNLSVTKNLFQALGAKLIVRQRPDQGEVLTIFLPLERV